MGSLGGGFGEASGAQEVALEAPGGPEKKGSMPRWDSTLSRNVACFVEWPQWDSRSSKSGGAPQLGLWEPSGKFIRSIGALVWRSWICKT